MFMWFIGRSSALEAGGPGFNPGSGQETFYFHVLLAFLCPGGAATLDPGEVKRTNLFAMRSAPR